MSCTGACNANQGRGKCPGGCGAPDSAWFVSEFEDTSDFCPVCNGPCTMVAREKALKAEEDRALRRARAIAIVGSAAAVIVCIVVAVRRFA